MHGALKKIWSNKKNLTEYRVIYIYIGSKFMTRNQRKSSKGFNLFLSGVIFKQATLIRWPFYHCFYNYIVWLYRKIFYFKYLVLKIVQEKQK